MMCTFLSPLTAIDPPSAHDWKMSTRLPTCFPLYVKEQLLRIFRLPPTTFRTAAFSLDTNLSAGLVVFSNTLRSKYKILFVSARNIALAASHTVTLAAHKQDVVPCTK